jgi:hypothetical protein
MLGLKQMNNKKIRLLQAALIELGLDYDEAFERACLIYMEIRVSSYIKKSGGV